MPHISARCKNVQSDIEDKQERRLALCYLKFHAYAIIRQPVRRDSNISMAL